jgi:hypothetical protein
LLIHGLADVVIHTLNGRETAGEERKKVEFEYACSSNMSGALAIVFFSDSIIVRLTHF